MKFNSILKFSSIFFSFMLCACTTPPQAYQTGLVENQALPEISGLAPSKTNTGLWWAHNDGDRGAFVYALNEKGTLLQTISIDGAENIDWEDIARFDFRQKSWLAIGDIGDNLAKRESISIYFLPEPAVSPNQSTQSVTVVHSLQLRYPDGPRDCESIAIDPLDNALYLLSKRDHPARLYRISLEKAFQQSSAELEFVAEISSIPPHSDVDVAADPTHGRWSDQATAMDISADGKQMALQTYKMAMIFNRKPGFSVASTLNSEYLAVKTAPLPQEEAIAFSLDGSYLMISSEFLPAPLLRVDLN